MLSDLNWGVVLDFEHFALFKTVILASIQLES